jgi:hypothetical protein
LDLPLDMVSIPLVFHLVGVLDSSRSAAR